MLSLFFTFMKIAILGFGGGSVIVSLIKGDFVDTKLITIDEFERSVAITQATPGPASSTTAAYIGYVLHGWVGAVIANIAIVLPSLIGIIIFLLVIKKVKNQKFVNNVFDVLKPVTLTMIISVTIFFINISVFKNIGSIQISDLLNNFNVRASVILAISLFAGIKYKVSPIYILLISSALSLVIL